MLHTDLPPASGGGGGVRHQVARLCDVLASRGHEIVVYVLAADSSRRSYQVRRTGLGRMCGERRAMRVILAPAAFASQCYSSFDLVHAHGDSELLLRRRVPVVRTFYGSALDEAHHAVTVKHRTVENYHYAAELVARRLARRTVGISQATAASIGRLDHIIPCGVDRERFHPGPKDGTPTVLFIGTMRGRKRGEFVARVFREFVRPRLPGARLILIAPDATSEPGIEALPAATDEQVAHCLRSAG
jgi:phosphatidylinositol alpha-mannosyltransferase